MSTLKNYKAAKQKLIEEAKSLIASAFKEFFEANPSINKASFVGYTPAFNDGDPCVFTLGGVSIWAKSKDDDENYDNDFVDEYDYEGPELKGLKELDETLEELVDIIPAVFSEYGFRAIFTRGSDEIEIEEYDCGY